MNDHIVERLLSDAEASNEGRTRLRGLREELACAGLALADLGIGLARLERDESVSCAGMACNTPLEDELTRRIHALWAEACEARQALTKYHLAAQKERGRV